MTVHRTTIAVTGASGGAGAATANETSSTPIVGTIHAIHLTYVGSPPAGTTDVTIAGVQTPVVPILTITDAATDGWFHPMWQADNEAGAAITNQGSPVVVDDQIKVTIAQANDADGVTAVIIWSDL